MNWYGMDNGLPQNSIKDIIQDKYGFIWLSTEGGVLRWDGDVFTTYNDFNLKNLSFGDFYGNANKDSIIIYSNFYDEGLLINQRIPKILSRKKYDTSLLYRNNRRYERYVKNSLTTKFFNYIDNYFIQVDDGHYYFDNKYITYVDNKYKRNVKININFQHTKLRKVFVHSNRIFIADNTQKAFLQLYKGKLSIFPAPSIYTDKDSKIYWQQSTGQVFIIRNGHVFLSKFNGTKLTTKLLLKYDGITNAVSGAMFYDERSKKLYIGSATKGLLILSLSDFYVSKKNIHYEDENYYAAVPFGKSSVITQQGIEYYKDKTKKIFYTPLTYDKRYLLYDGLGNLIYRNNNSIHKRFRKHNFKTCDSISFNGKKLDGLFKSHGLYMASVSYSNNRSELYVYKNDQFGPIDKIFYFNKNINSVLRYSRDIIYVGCTDGIYVVSLAKNKIIKNIAPELSVKQVVQTNDGKVWFTTYNKGIYLIKNNNVIRLPLDKNGYISNAHTILEDNQSNLWISTNNGLFKASKNALVESVINKDKVATYYWYTKADGFSNNEFNGSADPAANKLNDGQFVFPSIDGFIFFKPHLVKSYYPNKSAVFIERAKVNDEKMFFFKDKLYLNKDYKNANVFIDLPYYSNIHNIYLQAKFGDQKNSKWVNISNDRKFSINKMQPGEYELIVRFLTGKDGKFTYKTIPVEIEAYFYQTTYFKILLLLIVAFLIAVIVQWRTDFLKFKNRHLVTRLSVKDRELQETYATLQMTKNKLQDDSEYQKKLIASITHDISTPVKFISMLSKKLIDTDDTDIQKMCFESIYKSSEELYKFTFALKEYNDLYKKEGLSEKEYSLFDIIESKRALFSPVALQKNVQIFNISDVAIKVVINKNILSAILHNILDNAVKNTSDGTIKISTVVDVNCIKIRIADTGYGMNKEKMRYYNEIFKSQKATEVEFKNYGLGLHMVNQLIKKVDLNCIFNSNRPKGTVAIIIMNQNGEKNINS
ncbi:ATP-binding protein [Chryseobacterium sp. 2R14A]|uniref:sensor histidine kinase n=1 Tax=Chryseobacterium sp. 2R14A TaxID=3380353 RepID=UPI003CF9D5B0